MDWIAAAVEFDALETAWKKACGPLSRCDRLWVSSANAGQHYESGQIVALGAKPVRNPCTHAGATADRRACIHECMRGIVIDLFGDHGPDHAQVVCHLCMPGQEVADLDSAFAIALEFCERTEASQRLPLELGNWLSGSNRFGHWLAIHASQFRFVVERFQVRRPPGHAKEDDSLCPWQMIGKSRVGSRNPNLYVLLLSA